MKPPSPPPPFLPTPFHLPVMAVILSLGPTMGANAQEEKREGSPPGPHQVESVFDTLNTLYDNSITQSVQAEIGERMKQSADLELHKGRYRDLSIAEKALRKESLPKVERRVEVAKGNLAFLEKALRVVNVLGPVSTGLGVLAGGGSAEEAWIGGANDFAKFWLQEAGTSAGSLVGGAVGGVMVGSKVGEVYDKQIGVHFESRQQQAADQAALQRHGPLDQAKLARLSEVIGAQQRRADLRADQERKRIEAVAAAQKAAEEESNRRLSRELGDGKPHSAIAGDRGVPLPRTVAQAPSVDPFGPRPAQWPAGEPWPPSVDKLVELVNAGQSGGQQPRAEDAAGGSPSDFERPPAGPPPPNAVPLPPNAGSVGDFADVTAGSAEPTVAGGASDPASVVPQAPGGFDASAFARGQARDAAAAAVVVEGDYAEAARLENALRQAEEEFRRATLEAQRIAAQQRAAHQAAENAKAQRRAYEAYQRYVAQVNAYNQWIANARRAQQQQPSPGHGGARQQGTAGHKPGGILIDPPQ